MTTRVTIKNEAESKHKIELTFVGQRFVVNPGDSFTTHVWKDAGIEIRELQLDEELPPGWINVDGTISQADVKDVSHDY